MHNTHAARNHSLVELIVLNIGLSAGILNKPVFAIFVLMALLTTFATTPLTLAFYPEWYRNQMAEMRANGGGASPESTMDKSSQSTLPSVTKGTRSRFIVILNRLENLPSMMAFTKLLHSPIQYDDEALSEKKSALGFANDNISIDALRLYELTDRASAVIKAADVEETAKSDALSNIYSTFAGLNGFNVRPKLAIELAEDFPSTVSRFSKEQSTQMVVVPWSSAASAQTYSDGPAINPFDRYFKMRDEDASPQYAAFVRRIFLECTCDVALFLDQGVFNAPSAIPAGRQHIFLPFHGGPDDRACLDLVVQLCRHPGVTASIVRFIKVDLAVDDAAKSASTGPQSPVLQYTVHAGHNTGDTIYGAQSTENQLQSDTADNLIWNKHSTQGGDKETLEGARKRMTFKVVNTSSPLRESLAQAATEMQMSSTNNSLMIVTGRSRRAAPSHSTELQQYLKEHVVSKSGEVGSLGIAASSDVRKTLGDIASAIVVSGSASSLLVVQSGSVDL